MSVAYERDIPVNRNKVEASYRAFKTCLGGTQIDSSQRLMYT